MSRRAPLAAAALLLAPLVGCSPPTAPRAADAGALVPGRYIVVLRDGPGADPPRDVAARAAAPAGRVFTAALRGFVATLSPAEREALAADPDVAYVEPDRVVAAAEVAAAAGDVQRHAPWGLDRIDQRSRALDGTYSVAGTGRGVVVYVIDTGIRTDHVDFGGRASIAVDLLGGDGSDCNGHGTHVAAIVGGRAFGVAKEVTLRAVRVLDCAERGTIAGVIEGLDWVLAHRAPGVPAVANLSLAGAASQALDEAVLRATQAGVTVVVAAGNRNVDACSVSPARVPAAITVGSTGPDDRRAESSNRGACVDLFAPGVGIWSAGAACATDVRRLGGTSMAAAHVTGAAALYLETHPTAPPAAVRDALLASATRDVVRDARGANPHLLYANP